MNGSIQLTLKGSLSPFCHSYEHFCSFGYFFQKPLSNMPLKSLVSIQQLQTSTKNILASPSNVFTLAILLCRDQYCQCQSIFLATNSIPIDLFDNTISINFVVLKESFCLRKDMYLIFSSEVNNFIIRKPIKYFQVNIKNIVKHIDYICCYSS